MTAERNPPEEHTLLARVLEQLTALTLQAPGATLAACLAVAFFAIVTALNGLEFKTNRLDLLSPRSEYNRRWLNYLAEFGDRDDAVVVVQGGSLAQIGPALDDLAAICRTESRLFESVMHRRDLSNLKAKALHFLPVEDLRRIEQETEQAADLMEQGPAAGDPTAALAALNDRLERLGARSPEAAQAAITSYARLAGGLLPAVSPQGALPDFPAAPLPQGLSELDSKYLTAADGRLGFVLVRLVDNGNQSALGREAIAELRVKIEAARKKHPQVWIGLTGMPIIEHDEMASSTVDSTVSTLVSLLGVALLFAAGYGGLRHAGMACAALLLGIAWSFGFVTLSVGHLNILSASFGAILIGLGIDFGIHYVASYLRLRERGCDAREALLRTSHDVGPGVVTGAITTAAAFFTAGVTEFVGVAELGIVAGGGVLLCLCSALIALPPMIYLADRNQPAIALPKILPIATWLRPFHAAPKLIVTLTVIVGLGLAVGIGKLRYDHNLLNLQPKRLESSAIERELFTQLDDSVWFAVSVCETREELERRREQMAKLGTVAKIEEISSLTPAADPAKCRAIARIQEAAATAAVRPRPTRPLNAEAFNRELARARDLLTAEGLTQSPGYFAVAGLKQALDMLPVEQAAERLTRYGGELQRRISDRMAPLREVCDPSPPTVNDLPQELAERFVGKTQKQLLKIYARGNVWDMDRLEQFVRDVESVDPLVTGHPVQTYYASRHMQAGYVHAGMMAVIAVFGLVYLDFQSLKLALLAMTPLAIGSLTLFGLIGWLGIPLNAANMIVLPLILGIGVDDGVHLAHDFRRQRGRFKLGDSTALAVLLTSLTTMVSFGAMVFARHQGLQSLGQVLTLGTFVCLLTSLFSFPSLLAWLTADRSELDEDEPIVSGETEQAAEIETAESIPSPHFARPRRRVGILQSLADERAVAAQDATEP